MFSSAMKKHSRQLLSLVFLFGASADFLQAASGLPLPPIPVIHHAGQTYQYLLPWDFDRLESLPIWPAIERWRAAIESMQNLRIAGKYTTGPQMKTAINLAEQAKHDLEDELVFLTGSLEDLSLKELSEVTEAFDRLMLQMDHDENRWNFKTSTGINELLNSIRIQLEELRYKGHSTFIPSNCLTPTKDLL